MNDIERLMKKIHEIDQRLENIIAQSSVGQVSPDTTVYQLDYTHQHPLRNISNLSKLAGTGLSYSAEVLSTNDSEIDHGSLAGLTDEDHSLSAIANTTGDKLFTFANKGLKFKFTGSSSGAYDGMFELELTGNIETDVMHIHQHTGNVVAGSVLLHLHGEDADLLELEISGQGPVLSIQDTGDSDEQLLEFDTTARTLIIGAIDGNDNIHTRHYGNLTLYNDLTMTLCVDIIRDEDDMAADDVNALCTQQSIKKYVDDEVAGAGGGAHALGAGQTDVTITAQAHGDFLYFDSSAWVDKTTPEIGAILEADMSHDSLQDFAAGEHFTMLDEDDMATDSNTQAATQQSIKAYTDAANMIGSGNSAWVPCMLQMGEDNIFTTGGTTIKNIGSANGVHAWYLPLPRTRGGLDLYINSIKVTVWDADANDIIDHVYAYGLSTDADGAASTLFTNDGTNRTAKGTYTYAIAGAPLDISDYHTVNVALVCIHTGAGELDITSVRIECYYA